MRWLLSGLAALGLVAVVRAEDKVMEGQPAPEVKLEAATAKGKVTIDLKDYKGKKNVVLFFYPKALTGG